MSTFISYAQNFEDVILHRVLAGVEAGFYVDVGAQHPLRDSVTRAFYERGWRGVNIEPVSEWAGLLEIDRPEDVNLRVAVGASEGQAVFYEVHESGLSTTDASVASKHALDGFQVTMLTVPMMTLDAIIEEHGKPQIHFLKIDVEGGEADVLKGLSLDRHRPWVIVVEATLPNTQVDTSKEWDSLITASGYSMVYHDGLNRFYLADEHSALKGHFSSPPNFFDNFVRHADWERGELARRLADESRSQKERIAELEASLAESHVLQDEFEADLVDAGQRIEELSSELDKIRSEQLERERTLNGLALEMADAGMRNRRVEQLEQQLGAMLQSRSWRVTAPLRWAMGKIRVNRLSQPAGPAPSPVAEAPPIASAAVPAASRWHSAMPRVPSERRLLELASRNGVPKAASAPSHGSPVGVPFAPPAGRLDAVLGELRSLSYPPTSLPPKLDRLPGSGVLKTPALRLYERLFRKQALINEKVAEALRILRDNQRS